MSYVIPDPRWEEPNLLIPGKKPIGPVVLSPRLAQEVSAANLRPVHFFIYNQGNYDLVTEKSLDVYGGEANFYRNNVTASSPPGYFTLPTALSASATKGLYLVYRCRIVDPTSRANHFELSANSGDDRAGVQSRPDLSGDPFRVLSRNGGTYATADSTGHDARFSEWTTYFFSRSDQTFFAFSYLNSVAGTITSVHLGALNASATNYTEIALNDNANLEFEYFAAFQMDPKLSASIVPSAKAALTPFMKNPYQYLIPA